MDEKKSSGLSREVVLTAIDTTGYHPNGSAPGKAVAAREELRDHDAAQRGTIAQQAQEIARLRDELATAQARCKELEQEVTRSTYENAHSNQQTRSILFTGIKERDVKLQQQEKKLAELSDLCRQAGVRLTELTSPVHEP